MKVINPKSTVKRPASIDAIRAHITTEFATKDVDLSFDDIRAALGDGITDGEIAQAAQDAGLAVEIDIG